MYYLDVTSYGYVGIYESNKSRRVIWQYILIHQQQETQTPQN
jgi:hypothetical protein